MKNIHEQRADLVIAGLSEVEEPNPLRDGNAWSEWMDFMLTRAYMVVVVRSGWTNSVAMQVAAEIDRHVDQDWTGSNFVY